MSDIDQNEQGDASSTFTAALAGSGDEFVVADTAKAGNQKATIGFGVLAAAAGVGLFVMHQRTGGPATAEAATPAVEASRQSVKTFLAAGAGEVDEVRDLLADSEAIRGRFDELAAGKQVPLDALKTNPFYRGDGESDENVVTPPSTDAHARRLAAEQERLRREQADSVRRDAAALDVGIVLTGRSPSAMINGAPVSVGGNVAGFTVLAIDRRGVTVVREGVEATAGGRP
jgi:hypothetical protein